MCQIAFVAVSGRETPAVAAVSFEAFRILYRIGSLDEGMGPSLLIVVGMVILQSVRIDAHKGVLLEEQWSAKCFTPISQRKLDPVIFLVADIAGSFPAVFIDFP